MKARVYITLKPGVLDPQGKAVENALTRHLGFTNVRGVRQGKLIEIDIEEDNPAAAVEQLDAMCQTLLVNTVIEEYRCEVLAKRA